MKLFRAFFFAPVIFIFYLLSPTFYLLPIYAINMESPRFKIQFGNINETSGTKTSSNYTITDTVGQFAAGQFQSQGYIAKAGFQYLHSISAFRFTVSNSSLDFGSLNPGSFATAKTTLMVDPGSSPSYQVAASEDGPMKSQSGNIVANTLCNLGNETCSENLAKIWDSTSSFGFGYHLDGDDIPIDFSSSSHFRPFADTTVGKDGQIIMSNPDVSKTRQSTLTFKINVSPQQQSGTYQTVINFVATPGY